MREYLGPIVCVTTLMMAAFIMGILVASVGYGLQIKNFAIVVSGYFITMFCLGAASFIGSLALSKWAIKNPTIRHYLGI